MSRALVIGYGNLYRADDGVAYDVINTLRQSLGHGSLEEGSTGLEKLGAQIDSIFLTQLGPELIDTLADYDQVIFVDAHVREDVGDLYSTPVSPAYTPSAFTHHMTPAMLLALLQALHDQELPGYIVSIRGHDFGFRRGLSTAAAALVEPASARILQLLSLPGEDRCP
ncbi:MAG: hydrogenase maturation protease [Anaerolineales bacterium]|nr:MAG: hydrogenase maturation protease [Anaerolineales bacterium]